jgi:hypothetical protein
MARKKGRPIPAPCGTPPSEDLVPPLPTNLATASLSIQPYYSSHFFHIRSTPVFKVSPSFFYFLSQ